MALSSSSPTPADAEPRPARPRWADHANTAVLAAVCIPIAAIISVQFAGSVLAQGARKLGGFR